MVLLCAGKRIFKNLGKFHEKSQKIHAPEGNQYQKKGQRGAKGGPGALVARPSPWPCRGVAWVGPTSSAALPRLVFYLVTGKSQMRTLSPSFRRGAAALCSSSGGLIWR